MPLPSHMTFALSHTLRLHCRRVVKVPEKLVGVPHVLAVCPEDLEVAKAPEDASSVLLRFTSEAEVMPQELLSSVSDGVESQIRDDCCWPAPQAMGIARMPRTCPTQHRLLAHRMLVRAQGARHPAAR